jgi:hypothetical protein
MNPFSFDQLYIEYGTIQPLSDKEQNTGVLFCVRWKGGLTLRFSNRWSYYWIMVEKDDSIFQSIRLDKEKYVMEKLQKSIRDIERGAFSRRKSTAQLVSEIVQQRQLTSCMNNTKWDMFRTAMLEEMPFPPPYEIKTLFDNEIAFINYFITNDANYRGCYIDEDFVNLNYKVIEYLVVKTRYYETIGGMLVQQRVYHDATTQFLELMKKYHIPYVPCEKSNDTFFIYGYR